jgi:hypothetical protein
MEPSPSAPSRTIIVVDNHPSEVSFICSVLDAHALPYAIQVLDPDAPAFDPLVPLAQPVSRRAPTLIRLGRTRPLRAGQGLWRRLTALWPAMRRPRGRRYWTQRPTAAHPSPPRCRRWPCVLAWGISLGLFVGLMPEAPWLWLAARLPRGPLSPPPRSDSMTAGLLGTVVPGTPPAEVRPPAQSQTPVVRAHSTGTALGGTPTSGPRPPASVGRNAASLRPQAANQLRTSRDAPMRPPRKRYAPRRPVTLPHLMTVRDGAETFTSPRNVELARAVNAHRPRGAGGAPSAPVTLVARRS